jgi:putative transport protein
MDAIVAVFRDGSVAHAILVLSLVISLGLALGHVKVLRVSLGVGGVLFAGLAFGHLGLTLQHELMDFVKEFGLILFVFAIGLQVGPGFFSSLRKQGLTLNLLAAAIVGLGTLTAVVVAWAADIDFPTAVGLLSGAVTNTPSLGAAQQALKDMKHVTADATQMVGLGYAVAYPFGILGIIGTMLLVRRIFHIDPAREAEEFEKLQTRDVSPIRTRNYEITNPNLSCTTVERLHDLCGPGVTITRVYRNGDQRLATPECEVRVGDVVHAVGTEQRLDKFRVIVGRESTLELPRLPSAIVVRRVVVTQKAIVNRAVEELDFEDKYGVIITRVVRAGVEFTPMRGFRLHFGDRLVIVGLEAPVERVATEVGDSVKELDKPHIIPVFVGIGLGVLVGSIPLAVPHIPAPVKLGLAGGPLLVAIALGRIGKIGPLLSHMPNSANLLLRELGIALFLACVGLQSGEKLAQVLLHGPGFLWMALAALITVVPLVIVGLVARAVCKLNYVSLCGLLSGSMTDPPALAFATDLTRTEAPSIAYATVYPLTMLLRVVVAQVLLLVAMR